MFPLIRGYSELSNSGLDFLYNLREQLLGGVGCHVESAPQVMVCVYTSLSHHVSSPHTKVTDVPYVSESGRGAVAPIMMGSDPQCNTGKKQIQSC